MLGDSPRVIAAVALLIHVASHVNWAADDTTSAQTPVDIASERLEVMKSHALAIRVSSTGPNFPAQLQPVPLFRYDDQTRGYVDGLVWRLGATGRPLAIITTELHPNYLNGGPRIVYDVLSLTETPFTAKSSKFTWSPRGAAVSMQPLANAPEPAGTAPARLSRIKAQSRRFTATQHVTEELEPHFVHLRLLPKEIDRYQPTSDAQADGAVFLLVNGRNPGLILFLETDGEDWSYGVGRLSMPSTLVLMLDGVEVWKKPPGSESNSSYSASNHSATFP